MIPMRILVPDKQNNEYIPMILATIAKMSVTDW